MIRISRGSAGAFRITELPLVLRRQRQQPVDGGPVRKLSRKTEATVELHEKLGSIDANFIRLHARDSKSDSRVSSVRDPTYQDERHRASLPVRSGCSSQGPRQSLR